jgi:hypothetical protein
MLGRLALTAQGWMLDRRVRRRGWTGVYVGDYASSPTWAYTIGFDDTLDQPEVIVFDASREGASRLFVEAFNRLKAGTLVFEDWLEWPEDSEGRGVWRKVHPTRFDEGWLTLAEHRRWKRTGQKRGLEAFQYVLPDHDGRLPWQVGYDEKLRHRQIALWSPRP